MRRALILLVALLVSLALLPSVSAVIGCCCDPVVKNGSFLASDACFAKGHAFIGSPPDLFTTCSSFCESVLGEPTSSAVCGDGVCHVSEIGSCAVDCVPVEPSGCLELKPAPNVSVSPVRGERALFLSFDLSCPAKSFTISRCSDSSCSSESVIGTIAPSFSFIDDSDLEWGRNYTYKVVANYGGSDSSVPASASGSMGDLECWGRSSSVSFCLGAYSYGAFESYLKSYGYAGSTAFSSAFDLTVQSVFGSKFNSVWSCDVNNMLVKPSGALSCGSGEVCVADESGARCLAPQACGNNTDPFGLYGDVSSCESDKYCFFDRSSTVKNACLTCRPEMSCGDYKSAGACVRDNCFAGNCEWRSSFGDLGVGVCVDVDSNNCAWCSKLGTPGVRSSPVSSSFDACTLEKADALSTEFACVFDANSRSSKSCDSVVCSDYSQSSCGAPSGGIKLNSDNSVVSRSSDSCGIGVCDWFSLQGCAKNANGGSADCAVGDVECERDFFAPSTSLVASGESGRTDYLDVYVNDRIISGGPIENKVGGFDYYTLYCVVNSSNTCADTSKFVSSSSKRLLVKNGELKEGLSVLLALKEGNNTLKFFSRDPSDNIEVVKSLSIDACSACQGPVVLNLSISEGRFVKDTLFTRSKKPSISVFFDEEVNITRAELVQGSSTISLIKSGSGSSFSFVPSSDIEGELLLRVNAVNKKGVYMSSVLEVPVIFDDSSTSLTISPGDGSLVNSSVNFSLDFSGPVTLSRVYIREESYVDGFAIVSSERNVTSSFKNLSDLLFNAKLSLSGGRNVLVVEAQSFNGLPVFGESGVFVTSREPSLRLVKPSFGVSSVVPFDVVVESEVPGECKYVFGVPSAPSSADFDVMSPLSASGRLHSASGFSFPSGAISSPLHIYCRLSGKIVQRSFNVSFDDAPPLITEAFAIPSVIGEKFIPGKDIYVTTLKVGVNKPSFCKFAPSGVSYDAMSTFAGFNIKPKLSHSANVTVTEEKSYSYSVVCLGANDLLSASKTVSFSVDTKLKFNVSSSTPKGFSSRNFTIGVVGNKRMFCYYGESEPSTCMGDCRASYTQAEHLSVRADGNFSFVVKCSTVGGESAELSIPVVVDSTVPLMEFVDDSSPVESDPDVVWWTNKARVAMLGSDLESGISHYLVTLLHQYNRSKVFEDKIVSSNGSFQFISTGASGASFLLSDNSRYQFVVRAVNVVGGISAQKESDGFVINSSRVPAACLDGEKNYNETDVDCSGDCDACEVGLSCIVDADCSSNYCASGVCAVASCSDGVKNGVESGVDCGGSCSACGAGISCFVNDDCFSNYCSPARVCEVAPACVDGVLSSGESDVDCGGSCSKCDAGKACVSASDCASGLRCDSSLVCSVVADSDGDGVADVVDECPNTPVGESVDGVGCGLSQRSSLNDGVPDKWRLDFFGCIECPQAAASADPDGDGLSNADEYRFGTNPSLADSDGDGWSDGVEVSRGTSPVDPASMPVGILSSLLWVLFWLIVVAGLSFGGWKAYEFYVSRKPESLKPEPSVSFVPSSEFEISRLREFAKSELVDHDWLPLRRIMETVRESPLPKREFERSLERLRRIAGKEKVSSLRGILDDLPVVERERLLAKLRNLPHLSSAQRSEVFAKLRVTASYYAAHKAEFEREFARYGGLK